jgi:hydrogenase maturation protease
MTDPLDLLGVWDGAELAVVVDAVRSGAAPGTVHVVELDYGPGADTPAHREATGSTHGIGLASVLRLSRAVGHAPERVVVVGVEGEDFGRGTGLSPAVDAALAEAVRRVVDLIGQVPTCA